MQSLKEARATYRHKKVTPSKKQIVELKCFDNDIITKLSPVEIPGESFIYDASAYLVEGV